jgi:hypothetical protein
MSFLQSDKPHFMYPHVRLFFYFPANTGPNVFVVFNAAAWKTPVAF